MIDIFMPIQSFIKFDKVSIDNNVFRMHYRITVIMLLVFCVLVTSKQFFGEPIQCHGDGKEIKIIDNFCWIFGTYTMKLKGVVGKHMAYPGVGPSKKDDEQIRHAYYQWVCFVLLGQAVMFYLPRYLWKTWEGGRLKSLAADLNVPLIPKEWSTSRRDALVNYMSNCNMYSHNLYALRYALCELLNLCNAVGQIYLLDIFLGGAFKNYGSAVAMFKRHTDNGATTIEELSTASPMDTYFPKLTKCFYQQYGSSGGLEVRDFICVLPLNIVNEKIFVFLWFWLIVLSFLSMLAVLFRIVIFSLPPLRTMLILGQLRSVKRRIVSKIVRNIHFGDWFMLYLLGKNMNPLLFKELILELYKEIDKNMADV